MKKLLLIAIFLFIFVNRTYPATLIDTGEPSDSSSEQYGSLLYRFTMNDTINFHWVAGKISLTEEWKIDSIKTFFHNNDPQNFSDQGSLVDLTLIIYGNVETDIGSGIIADVPDLNMFF